MVWGGFSVQHRTPLYHVQGNLTAQRYRDEIPVPLAVPLLRQIGPQVVLQDDNARTHRTRLVDNCLQQVGVTRMDWPASSPDLHPNEYLWDLLECRVHENHPPPLTLRQLLALLQMEGQAIR